MKKIHKIIINIGLIFIGLLIIYIASPLEILKYRDSFILCLNRRYFATDRYKYLHIIGNHEITSEFGNVFLKTGDKVINHKGGYLGTFLDINNHTLNILDNDIKNIEYFEIYFYDSFNIKLNQEINIYGKLFNVKYIIYECEILTFYINDFPEEIILNNNVKIELNDKKYNDVIIKIIENKIYLDINNYSVKDYYFIINNNEILYNSTKICIDNNWNSIIKTERYVQSRLNWFMNKDIPKY